MEQIETFGSTLLQDVAFNEDGSLKQSGKQNVKFYNKKRLAFRARPKLDADGKQVLDKNDKPVFLIDPKTGTPFKDAYEGMVVMVRIETRGDTNIIDDIADDLRKKQYYRHYKFFREGKVPDGNPIEDFDFLQPSTVMELHMLGIHVLQQVAVMSDIECEQLKDQSGFEVRDIAAKWVKINSPQGQAGKATRLELENAQLKRQLEEARSAGNAGRRRLVEQEVAAPDEPIETLEMSPEDLAKGPKGRTRKV
jgi:hypothetical protein